MTVDTEPWHDFGVAVAGAAAALTGLLFVALSINLDNILKFRSLPIRAGGTLVMLTVLLLVGVCLLVPDQRYGALGAEIGALALPLLAMVGVHLRPTARDPGTSRTSLAVLMLAVPAALLITGGVIITGGSESGLYWVFGATVAAFCAGLVNAWVLMVEILR